MSWKIEAQLVRLLKATDEVTRMQVMLCCEVEMTERQLKTRWEAATREFQEAQREYFTNVEVA